MEYLPRMPDSTERRVQQATRQLGTLGTGNHFVEVCLDEEGFVWTMLHSGSRGIGRMMAHGLLAWGARVYIS